MAFSTTLQLSAFIIFLGFALPVQSIKVNITKFANCQLKPDENLEHFVDFTDIKYEINADGLCDVVHAKYYIPTILTSDKLMNITMMRCKADSTDTCNDNAEHFYEILHCERFHKDESGPWYMLSDGMDTGSKCGEKVGQFELVNARLKPEYLTDFMVHDVDYPRHRMLHMIRKNIEGTDDVIVRACIDMEFTVIF